MSWPAGIVVDSLVGCHPGLGHDSGSPYGRERAVEVATLCDPRVRETVCAEGIALSTFRGALAPEPMLDP